MKTITKVMMLIIIVGVFSLTIAVGASTSSVSFTHTCTDDSSKSTKICTFNVNVTGSVTYNKVTLELALTNLTISSVEAEDGWYVTSYTNSTIYADERTGSTIVLESTNKTMSSSSMVTVTFTKKDSAKSCLVTYTPVPSKISRVCTADTDTDGTSYYYNKSGTNVEESEYLLSCYACKNENSTYYDESGNETDEETWNNECNEYTPICEYYNGQYYGPDGKTTEYNNYLTNCGLLETCSTSTTSEYGGSKETEGDEPIVGEWSTFKTWYFNSSGESVTEEEYKADCYNCMIDTDNKVYYNKSGNEATYLEYLSSCGKLPTCSISTDITGTTYYFDANGNTTDEDGYNASCTTCTYNNGNYYDRDGNITDYISYLSSCDLLTSCGISTDKDGNKYYFDSSGNEITAYEYDDICGTVENPKTGIIIPLIGLLLGATFVGVSYYMVRKKKKTYQI